VVLGGKIVFMMTWGESPAAEHVPTESHNLIIHATLSVGGQVLMGSDAPPDRYEKPKGLYVSLHFKDKAKGERVFNALAENGIVQCHFSKPSGPWVSVCASINSEFRG
jgi:PhnB protein